MNIFNFYFTLLIRYKFRFTSRTLYYIIFLCTFFLCSYFFLLLFHSFVRCYFFLTTQRKKIPHI
ncbi:hypothetical protein RhiirA4_43532 [Rhizophagus irregularis]|uniref:Uncharacterized protein n=1 Tax=Rhizophagus irregularis TaxID=588596 RepID=A0A2I1H413_9GLOM|nr:hypothetical protein RhiirA4_43532 [Rhizophagus irregularis]